MVKVRLRQKNPDNLNEWIEKEIYLDGYLKSNLDLGISQLHKDWDQVWFIDGVEGAGKTSLGVTAAYYVNKEETRHSLLHRIAPNAEMAERIIMNAKPFEAVVIDEFFGGASTTGFMAKINRLLQRRFTEIRAKNLFIFIIAPTFMDISRYFAIWRSKCLLHVYSKGDERGFCAFYNSDRKKKLYIIGKKRFYDYSCVSPNFVFRFVNEMARVIDKPAYEEIKRKANLDIKGLEPPPELMKQCWMRVLSNIPKLKHLTNEDRGVLIEISQRNIERYNTEMNKAGLIAENSKGLS